MKTRSLVALALALALVVLIPSQANACPINQAALSVFERLNDIRTSQGIQTLTYNLTLASVAQAKAEEIAKQEQPYSHLDKIGIRAWPLKIQEAGYNYIFAGENLAGYWGNYDLFSNWMASPTHRKNILDPKYEDTGIGVATSNIGEYRVFVVQYFGTADKSLTKL